VNENMLTEAAETNSKGIVTKCLECSGKDSGSSFPGYHSSLKQRILKGFSFIDPVSV
jgi:hypothetical protein